MKDLKSKNCTVLDLSSPVRLTLSFGDAVILSYMLYQGHYVHLTRKGKVSFPVIIPFA